MIQAKELRIGNYVMINSKPLINEVVFTVDEIYSQDVYLNKTETSQAGTFKYSELEPIPLNPEILEKCGFVFDERNQSYRIMSHKNEWILAVQMCLQKEYGAKVGLPTQLLDIYWTQLFNLHQLQNLYWCLCGEELNYTP